MKIDRAYAEPAYILQMIDCQTIEQSILIHCRTIDHRLSTILIDCRTIEQFGKSIMKIGKSIIGSDQPKHSSISGGISGRKEGHEGRMGRLEAEGTG